MLEPFIYPTLIRPFFHSFCHAKNARMRINKIQNSSSQWLQEKGDIAREAVNFFQQFYIMFRTTRTSLAMYLLLFSLLMIITLSRLPSLNEVREAVFFLDKNSSPGSDGFSDLFFNTTGLLWDVISWQW